MQIKAILNNLCYHVVCSLDIAVQGYIVSSLSYPMPNIQIFQSNSVCGQEWVAVLHVEQHAHAVTYTQKV